MTMVDARATGYQYDGEALRRVIKERGLKLGYVAMRLRISYPTLKGRLDGKTSWDVTEAATLTHMLALTPSEMDRIMLGGQRQDEDRP